MFKPSILIVLGVALTSALLLSCAGNTTNENKMQKPTDQSTEAVAVSTKATMSPELAKATNIKNMQDAFKGETTASAKYAAYSKKAEEEGYHEIAMLFKATSKSENIHAGNHKEVLQESGAEVPSIKPEFKVGTTAENLKDAIAGETYEVNTMYPEFLTNANAAGAQLSSVSLNYAYKTEMKHKVFFEKALAALESKNVKSLSIVYYVCPTCGNTYDTTPPKRCGISMTSSEKIIKIEALNS
jgi:rubrerythrin